MTDLGMDFASGSAKQEAGNITTDLRIVWILEQF